MDKVIERSKSGTYTLERMPSGRYVIKCEGRVLHRHGEFEDLEKAMWRWGCYRHA